MYIIRTAFWLAVVILLIPGEDEDGTQVTQPPAEQTQISAGDAVNAALSTIGDLAGLCGRRPEVCETGSAAWQAFQRKAVNGVDTLYRWTTGSDRDRAPAGVANPEARPQTEAHAAPGHSIVLAADDTGPVYTGSAAQPQGGTSAAQPRSQNTLRLDDLIPPFGGPVAGSQERA